MPKPNSKNILIKTIPVNLILRCLSRALPFLRLLPLPCQVFPVLRVHLRKTSLPGNPGFNASVLLLKGVAERGSRTKGWGEGVRPKAEKKSVTSPILMAEVVVESTLTCPTTLANEPLDEFEKGHRSMEGVNVIPK